MHSDDKVRAVFAVRREGIIHREIAERTGVSLAQVRKWLYAGEETVLSSPMRQTATTHDAGVCPLVEKAPTRAYEEIVGPEG